MDVLENNKIERIIPYTLTLKRTVPVLLYTFARSRRLLRKLGTTCEFSRLTTNVSCRLLASIKQNL